MPPAAKSKAAPGQVLVLVGSDEGRVKEAAMRLVQKLSPADAGDFGTEVIEGQADNAAHAAQLCADCILALQTLPFFGGGKVVWLKMANFLGDSVTGRAQETVEAFERLVEVLEAGLGPEIYFVLSATAMDKRRTVYKRLGKLADIEIHDKPDTSKDGWEQEVGQWLAQKAKALGLSFEPEAFDLLVQLAGDDSRQLENELQKLDVYLGTQQRRCSLADVRGMVSMSRAGVIWELGHAVGRRDLPRALELLNILLEQGQNAVGLLLAAIVPRVRSMLLVQDLLSRHRLPMDSYSRFVSALERLPRQETMHLPRKKDGSGINAFGLFSSAGDARRFSVAELREALVACLQANSRLVTTQLDERLVLERLLVGMLARREKRGAMSA
jgi:DNA polymerase-3 subunit delta